jgi:hypothetical protein
MVTKQITFTEQEIETLEKFSKEQNISLEEFIQQSLNIFAKQNKTKDREELIKKAMSMAGKFDSGLTDVSVNHDEYLADAYAQ